MCVCVCVCVCVKLAFGMAPLMLMYCFFIWVRRTGNVATNIATKSIHNKGVESTQKLFLAS